jgi:hypothetical protein
MYCLSALRSAASSFCTLLMKMRSMDRVNHWLTLIDASEFWGESITRGALSTCGRQKPISYQYQ